MSLFPSKGKRNITNYDHTNLSHSSPAFDNHGMHHSPKGKHVSKITSAISESQIGGRIFHPATDALVAMLYRISIYL
jgi:hypothetical protein